MAEEKSQVAGLQGKLAKQRNEIARLNQKCEELTAQCKALVNNKWHFVWASWNDARPKSGEKIIYICWDGCSAGAGIMTDEGLLDAEDGMALDPQGVNLKGAIWMRLPDDFELSFMQGE